MNPIIILRFWFYHRLFHFISAFISQESGDPGDLWSACSSVRVCFGLVQSGPRGSLVRGQGWHASECSAERNFLTASLASTSCKRVFNRAANMRAPQAGFDSYTSWCQSLWDEFVAAGRVMLESGWPCCHGTVRLYL